MYWYDPVYQTDTQCASDAIQFESDGAGHTARLAAWMDQWHLAFTSPVSDFKCTTNTIQTAQSLGYKKLSRPGAWNHTLCSLPTCMSVCSPACLPTSHPLTCMCVGFLVLQYCLHVFVCPLFWFDLSIVYLFIYLLFFFPCLVPFLFYLNGPISVQIPTPFPILFLISFWKYLDMFAKLWDSSP